ncbi:MAG: hypothetical protein DI536_07875 [Archangium gephyra]|uniref:Lipoprotein n=1 Tax=Archangium gephyra TaxID=48 RepID=A0A2W5TPT7_9BACT|nr:MAG: hypothetical protein DI536_07875 [Archangium gephyra]
MKRVVIVLMLTALAACDWDDAEKKARCRRDPACASSVMDAGAEDAGEPDAGTADAGAADAGVDAGAPRSVFFPADDPVTARPIGLFPGSAGRVWVVGDVDERSVVQLRDATGQLVRDFSFDGSVAAAYADGEVYPALVLLRDDPDLVTRLQVLREDGTVIDGGARGGTDVSLYVFGGQARVSLWNADSTSLSQEIFNAVDLSPFTNAGSTECNTGLVDLQVQPEARGGAVAIVYNAPSTCTSTGPAQGIVVGRVGGVQTITPAGVRAAGEMDQISSVGGSLNGELRIVRRPTPYTLELGIGVWDGGVLQFVSDRRVFASEGVLGGDVSDNFVTFNSRGNVLTDTTGTGSSTGTPRVANVARITSWVKVELGQSRDARMPVLRVGEDNVWVLWAPADGGLQLSNFDTELRPR